MTEAKPFLHPLPPGDYELPAALDYPHHYTPAPVAVAAAEDLQRHLLGEREWIHDFGLNDLGGVGGKGKMFGVLVCETSGGQLGYLAAYSGKLADSNHLPGFVPPVFDILDPDGFYKRGERELYALSDRIEALEQAPELATARQQLADLIAQSEREIAKAQAARRTAKAERKQQRRAAEDWPQAKREALLAELSRQSVARHFALKDLRRVWEERLTKSRATLKALTDEIDALKAERSAKSNDLQHRIFSEFRFLNAAGAERDLTDLFKDTAIATPPAGAGECCAPKLFQFAFLHELRPVALAEFWWGQSPPSAVRRHGHYYTACRGKCLPILAHMLSASPVAPNPLLEQPADDLVIPIVYEDDHLVIVNKPPEFLSVRGRTIEDSVQARMETRYPEVSGPLIVHRLDMSTSGLLVLTKTKATHESLQRQFTERTVKKRYVAVLDGDVEGEEGIIDLPLRLDYLDRPRQTVCYERGKPARTRWKVVKRSNGLTRVHLWPETGRTHQLRVHCAHPLGLDVAMVGDVLYGKAAPRLHLHAEWISFLHPETEERVEFMVAASF